MFSPLYKRYYYPYMLAPTGGLAWWGNFITNYNCGYTSVFSQLGYPVSQSSLSLPESVSLSLSCLSLSLSLSPPSLSLSPIRKFQFQNPDHTTSKNTHDNQEPTKTCKHPIGTRYLGHVTGYQPIRDQYFLIRSVPELNDVVHYYMKWGDMETSRVKPGLWGSILEGFEVRSGGLLN
eukprot:sb/3471868/